MQEIWTKENILIIDIQTVKDSYHSLEVTNVALVRSKKNVLNALEEFKFNFIMSDAL